MLLKLILEYKIDIVSIGNGTASRESEKLIAEIIKEYNLDKSKSIMIGNDCSSDIAIANACGMDSLFIHANISPPLPKEIPATYAILDGDFRKVAPLILK